MDKAKFFAALRARGSGVFGTSLSQSQVSGTESILDEAAGRSVPLRHLAYILATAYHETAHTMQPIHERGAVAYFNKYEPGTKIGRDLGNAIKGDGFRFRGRGYVQLTGRTNYVRASNKLKTDFVSEPDRALEPRLAAAIMFTGMAEGWFTTKKLTDYILGTKADYIGARRIINGTDKAKLIAGYAVAFERALTAAGYTADMQPAPKPVPAPQPRPRDAAPPAPVSARQPDDPGVDPDDIPAPNKTAGKTLIGIVVIAIFAALAAIFGGTPS